MTPCSTFIRLPPYSHQLTLLASPKPLSPAIAYQWYVFTCLKSTLSKIGFWHHIFMPCLPLKSWIWHAKPVLLWQLSHCFQPSLLKNVINPHSVILHSFRTLVTSLASYLPSALPSPLTVSPRYRYLAYSNVCACHGSKLRLLSYIPHFCLPSLCC